MDEELDTSVDTSDVDTSDVDSSADMDFSDDVSEDIPDDIPDDIPEEDYSEEIGNDELTEDIEEDTDVPSESDDYSDEIPDEVVEDDTETDDIDADDIQEELEDIPEDQSTDLDNSDDSSDDLQDELPEDISSDDSSDASDENDTVDSIPEDVGDNEQPTDDQTDVTEDTVADETAEAPSDTEADEQPTDDQTDATEDTTADETAEAPSDTETDEQPADDQTDATEDTTADETAEAPSDTETDEQPTDDQTDATEDTTADETAEAPSDTETDEQPADDQTDVTEDTAADDVQAESGKTGSGPNIVDKDVMGSDLDSDTTEKSAMDRMSEYMSSHNYGLDDKGTYMADPEWIAINRDLKAELGIPQTAQEQMADYLGSHNYGIWDRDTYMKDPEWQSLNEALQNEASEINTSNSFEEPELLEAPESKGSIQNFFSNLFGAPNTTNQPSSDPNLATPAIDVGHEETNEAQPISQILQQPQSTDTTDTPADVVKAVNEMDFNDLSQADKDLMYNTAKQHIGNEYGDLVGSDRLDEIPKHIKIADTEECRKAYEASGGKYGDNTVGFYCPATDEIYVDAPRNGDMTEIMATIEHESLHLASNGGLNGSLEIMDGVSSYRRSTNLNEGVTELYAMRDMDSLGFDYKSSSYQQQVDVVRSLEDAIGKDTVRTAYFKNKPDLIRSEFEKAFATPEEISQLAPGKTVHNGKYIDFLNSLDEYIDTSPYDPSYSSKRDTVYNWISNLKQNRRGQ